MIAILNTKARAVSWCNMLILVCAAGMVSAEKPIDRAGAQNPVADRQFFLSAINRLERGVEPADAPPYRQRCQPIVLLPMSNACSKAVAEMNCERTAVRKVIRRSQQLATAGRHDEAIEALRDELKTARTEMARSVLSTQIGCVHFEKGDYESAARSVDEYDALNPVSAIGRCNRAAVAMFVGEYAEALGLLEPIQIELIEKQQFKWAVHFNLSCAYSLSGRVNEAVEHFTEAYIIDPNAVLENLNDPHLANIRNNERVIDLIAGLVSGREREVEAKALRLERMAPDSQVEVGAASEEPKS